MSFQALFERFWRVAGAAGIRAKILGIVLGMVCLLGLGVTLQTRVTLARTMDEQLRQQSVSVARDLAARATDLILLKDYFGLHQLLVATQSNYANIRYAFILDSESRIIAHTFGDEFPSSLVELNSAEPSDHHNSTIIQTNEGYIWDTAVPILEKRAGIARVGLSDAGVQAAIQTVTGQLLLTTVLVSVVGITAAVMLTWILTRPVLELVQATQKVTRGDFNHRVRRWANDEVGELAEAFNQMAVELARVDELRREREQLRRQLLEKVIATQEEERRRIARELHDSTSQSLTSLMVGLRMMENDRSDGDIQDQARGLRQVAAQALEEVHDLAMQLRPRVLDDWGLAAALERLAKEWGTRHAVSIDLFVHLGEDRLPGAAETTIYRIIQEALTNIARHAQADSASILVELRGGEVVVVVEDNGIGFPLQNGNVREERRLGLLGMRERAELLGGRVIIESIPGGGTSVFVQIPIKGEDQK